MIAASQHEQRRANEGLRLLHKLWHSTRVRGVVIAAALALTLWPQAEFHRGSMDASFNQDCDVDTLRLKVRGGFEFRAGGGSLNVVNERWDRGIELIRLPL